MYSIPFEADLSIINLSESLFLIAFGTIVVVCSKLARLLLPLSALANGDPAYVVHLFRQDFFFFDMQNNNNI